MTETQVRFLVMMIIAPNSLVRQKKGARGEEWSWHHEYDGAVFLLFSTIYETTRNVCTHTFQGQTKSNFYQPFKRPAPFDIIRLPALKPSYLYCSEAREVSGAVNSHDADRR